MNLKLPLALGIEYKPKKYTFRTINSPQSTSRSIKPTAKTEPDGDTKPSKFFKIKGFRNTQKIYVSPLSTKRDGIRSARIEKNIIEKNRIFDSTHKSALREYLKVGEISEEILYSDWLQFMISKSKKFKPMNEKKNPFYVEREIKRKVSALQRKLDLDLIYFKKYAKSSTEEMEKLLVEYNKHYMGFLTEPLEFDKYFSDLEATKPIGKKQFSIEATKRQSLSKSPNERISIRYENTRNYEIPNIVEVKKEDISPIQNIDNLKSQMEATKSDSKMVTASMFKIKSRMQSTIKDDIEYTFLKELKQGNLSHSKSCLESNKGLVNIKDPVHLL